MSPAFLSRHRTEIFVVVGLFGVGCLGTLLLVLVMLFRTPESEPPVYDRDEFRQMVTGRNQQEILELLGRPDFTSDTGPDAHWFYRRRTRDPIAQTIDPLPALHFRNGKVVHVQF